MSEPRYPLVSQKQLWTLLHAYRRGERISTMSAMLQYRIAALSQRTGELRALGWDIRSESVPNEGDGYHFEYYLDQQKEESCAHNEMQQSAAVLR